MFRSFSMMRRSGPASARIRSSVSGRDPLSTTIISYGTVVRLRIESIAISVNSGAFQLSITIEASVGAGAASAQAAPEVGRVVLDSHLEAGIVPGVDHALDDVFALRDGHDLPQIGYQSREHLPHRPGIPFLRTLHRLTTP